MCNFKIGNCRGGRGSNKMHQGENYENFLKWDGGDCFQVIHKLKGFFFSKI